MIEVLDKDGGGVVYALLTNYLTITKTNNTFRGITAIIRVKNGGVW